MRFLIFIFLFMFSFADDINETNQTTLIELNLSLPQEEDISQNLMGDSDNYNLEIAIILDKSKFFEFIPSLLNSINAYLINKDINYHLKLFNKEENLTKQLNEVSKNYPYILFYSTNPQEMEILKNYPFNYFFIPTLHKSQAPKSLENIFFGGIDYKAQIKKLNNLITDYTYIVYENKDILKYITSLVDTSLLQPHKVVKYPFRNYKRFDNTFVYLNTKTINTAQILSNFTYNKVNTKAILSTQINYSPLIFSLTNKADTKNLIISNSILNISPTIKDNNLNLNSDISFNWLNFTTSTLLNKIYNIEIGEDEYFLNDFDLYIYFNQVNYKTNLYKIYQNGFIKIEN